MDSRLPIIRIILIILFMILMQVSEINAQSKSSKYIVIKSLPAGAMVHFKGENSFVGITPFRLNPNFRGHYKIVVTKQGYEKRNYEFLFSGKEKGTLNLNLSPKTRFKAGVRSVLFPGWGQIYSERKTFGTFISILQIGALIGTANSVRNYNSRVDDYEAAVKEYEKNKKYFHLRETYWQNAKAKYDKANKAFDNQQMWVWISGGIWLYNVLDSVFFFPSFDDALINRSVPTLSSCFYNDGSGLQLTFSF